MKLARCTHAKQDNVFWALVDSENGTARPIDKEFAFWAPHVTQGGRDVLGPLGDPVPLEQLRLLAPVDPSAKIVAAGATYAKHVEGLGLRMPKQPAAFLKPFSSLVGPDEHIEYPELTKQLDFEVELVVVVGSPIDRANPGASILGFTVGNDVSARDLQFSGSVTGMDMFSAKALDRTSPLGPWITTQDEAGGEHPDLELSLTVNSEQRQSDRTSSMVWSCGELLDYIDRRTRLAPGDVVFTGTPSGVAHESGLYLQPGDVVEASVEGLGVLCNTVGPRPTATA